jgi:serine/threonine protein kinase
MLGGLCEGAIVASRYRLERPLGEGGFAVVWAAAHVVTRRRVALKFLKESFCSDTRVRQRFLREARAASAVRHPNVIVIHDVFEEGDRPIMVMDLLEGESLGERLKREGALPVGDVAATMLPVLSAVATAHAQGIVHRDLKPDNIFLVAPSKEGGGSAEVRVLDFGIAKLTAREGDAAQSSGLTNTGALLGTPYYMSPEQVFGDGEVDHRSDVWSIGVILYESLAGVRPTQADTVGQVMKILASESITPLARRKDGLPADVLDVVDRALSFDRSKRPTMEELGGVLSAHTSVKMPPVGEPAALPAGLSAANQASEAPDVRTSTQSPLAMSTRQARRARRVMPAALGLLAGAAAIGVAAWRSNPSAPAAAPPSGSEPVTIDNPAPAVSSTTIAAASTAAANTQSPSTSPGAPASAGHAAPTRTTLVITKPSASTAAAAPPPSQATPDPASYR